MKRENNKKEMPFVKKNLYLILGCFLLLCISTVVYAALNQSLFISGDLVLRSVKDIRITNLTYNGNTNSEELFNAKFTANTITISNNPTSSTGSVVYKATMKNSGTVDMEISNITSTTSNTGVYVNVFDPVKIGTIIKAGETVEFVVTISGAQGSGLIEFEWKEVETIVVAAPDLLDNKLVPIKYNGSKWVIVDASSNWYNYSQQEWANAAILTTGTSSTVGKELNIDTDVEAMYVWIPRYEYKIDDAYGVHIDGTKGTNTTPGQISVKFIDSSKTTPDAGYVIHSAFWWDMNENNIREDGEELNGIWVAKFETSSSSYAQTSSEMEVYYEKTQNLPDKTVLDVYKINNQVNIINGNKVNVGLPSDAKPHMMKNSEWGAVAYLSQSIYGKYGNTSYTGVNKEIYKNDSTTFTGKSSGKPSNSGSSVLGTCNYDDITDRGNGTGSCGGGASTTGNITGVYDMSGGVLERVAAYYTGASISFNLDSATYDVYGETLSTACNNKPCYGHALSETSGWYSDASITTLTKAKPWIVRGGSASNSTTAGIFAISSDSGSESTVTAFRPVLISRNFGTKEIDTDNLLDKVICDSYDFSENSIRNGIKCRVLTDIVNGNEIRPTFYVLNNDTFKGTLSLITAETYTYSGELSDYSVSALRSYINNAVSKNSSSFGGGLLDAFSYVHKPHEYNYTITQDLSSGGSTISSYSVDLTSSISENNIKVRLPHFTEVQKLYKNGYPSWLLSNTDEFNTSDIYSMTSIVKTFGEVTTTNSDYGAQVTANDEEYPGIGTTNNFRFVIEISNYDSLAVQCNKKKVCCCPTGSSCECLYK